MSVTVNHYQSKSHMFTIAAHDFLAELEKVIGQKEFFDVALSGGSTAKEFFSFLVPIAMYHPHLHSVRFFFSDERAVPLKSPESNAGNAWRLLLEPLNIEKSQFFPMYDEKIGAKASAHNYDELLSNLSKKGDFSFDLLYLGLGLDGHIASLFPGSVLRSEKLAASTIEPDIDFERITLMPRAIKAAKKICLLATGSEKIALIEQIRAGKETYPADLVLKDPKVDCLVLTA